MRRRRRPSAPSSAFLNSGRVSRASACRAIRAFASRCRAAREIFAPHRRHSPRRDPHRDRRADRPFRALVLHDQPAPVHHELPYPFRRLCGGALSGPAGLDLGLAALVPQCRPGTMVSTPSLAEELRSQGFRTVLRWPRGVDSRAVPPRPRRRSWRCRARFFSRWAASRSKRMSMLSCARPARQQGGGRRRAGPRDAGAPVSRRDLSRHPARRRLAAIYAAADVFVFPSRTDTFGLVLLEALASGLPIAGFPVAATRDVVGSAPVAVLDEDLQRRLPRWRYRFPAPPAGDMRRR